MKTIKGLLGLHISEAAQQLVANHPARLEFNGIELQSAPGKTAGDIVAEFEAKCEERRIAYKASPEGIKATRESEERRRACQSAVDRAVLALNDLDFRDIGAVIRWFEGVTDPMDHIGVLKDRAGIVARFEQEGYIVGANCGAEFNGEDRENFARYIVGQALDGIRVVGAPHGLTTKFAEEWRQKFGG